MVSKKIRPVPFLGGEFEEDKGRQSWKAKKTWLINLYVPQKISSCHLFRREHW